MSLIGKLEKKVFNLSLSDPKAWDRSLWNFLGSQSISGENVTEETALTYSAFWNGVNLISGTVSTLPLHLMQKTGKSKQIASQKSSYRVMHSQWNPYVTSEVGRSVMMAHILTWGNGYAEKVRNGYGEIIELWPIPPNKIISMEMLENELVYGIRVGNETKYLSREKILHIPGLGFDGFQGYSVVAMARKSIGLGMAMETFGSRYFGEGIHPTGIVTHPGQLADENLRAALKESYAGLGQSHRLMLLEEGMKFDKTSIQPEDSQFLESRQHHISDIARWLNIPPHKLKDLTKSSFNNIESEQLSYYGDCILLWLVRLEQNYNMQLLSPREQKEGFYYKHSVEGILRADAKSRSEFYKNAIMSTWMTPNEARALEDMNPSNNPLADELFIMANMIPLSKFEDYLAKNQGKQPGQPSASIEDHNKRAKLFQIVKGE